ncbi:MAG: UDP-N-acetylglucosamine 2-epimerase (non-hydrolyzing) [Caldilineales bacterium]|nr:UDP-N-acetylglucosamine 2-epimerase (non-hydrolyzing) [Caldilineales bacterium]
MKILTVVGARPQFIKATPVSQALQNADISEFLVHTGQHYDANMSQVFFDELSIPQPDLNLGVGSGSHGKQTGEMLMRLEEVMMTEKPDWTLVYGDTNSTLAATLAAIKLHIPVAHVEAGLRSFNRRMPEEHNRVITDRCADLLFCPTQTAMDNLSREGIDAGAFLVGDVMYDSVLAFAEIARQRSQILDRLGLTRHGFLLATVHRPANTDDPQRLNAILEALTGISDIVVFPLHPRTRKKIQELGWKTEDIQANGVMIIEPTGYLDMLALEQNARLILTDSGGVQKESYFFATPCITLRDETEWVETLETGWNVLAGADSEKIMHHVSSFAPTGSPPSIFGDGHAAQKIAYQLLSH